MSRNLNPTMAAALSNGLIQPAVLVMLTLRSGVEYVWSGVGDLVYGGHTFQGVGMLGSVGPINEASAVKAEGTTVTLSGIGLSQVPQQSLGITPPAPPVTVPAGQTVAWAYPAQGAPDFVQLGNGATGFFDPCTGTATAAPAKPGVPAGGGAFYTVSAPLGNNWNGCVWSDFRVDGGLPLDAVIHGIYPVIAAHFVQDIAYAYFYCGSGLSTSGPGGGTGMTAPSGGFTAQVNGPSIGTSLSDLTHKGISMLLNTSIYQHPVSDALTASNVAYAVYYSSASGVIPPATMLNEALADIRLGAAAKIWFGLMSNGAFLGAPYLVFSGTVDKPTVTTGAASSSITLAFENRLVNLQRASQRRYTSADQHLSNPDDMGFNWVEILNDIALRWGN